MTKDQAIRMARENAATAIDQAHEHRDLATAFADYFDNMRDTLTEHGVTDPTIIRAAEEAFYAARCAHEQKIEGEKIGNYSKEVRDGVLVYSATGKPVFPGPTGNQREVMIEKHESYRGRTTPDVEWRVWNNDHTSYMTFKTKREAKAYAIS